MGIIHTIFGSLEPKDRAELARCMLPRHRSQATTVESRPTIANILGPERRGAPRSMQELLALCRTVLAEEGADDSDANFLLDWIDRNHPARDIWPGNVLFERLSRATIDRYLDPREELELLDVLRAVAGGPQASPAPAAGGTFTFDDPPPVIVYPTRRFVVTGQFVYGPRQRVEAAIVTRGGVCSPAVTANTGYLIVGAFGSEEWRQGNAGSNIGEAVALKAKGQPISIVSERHWHEQLG